MGTYTPHNQRASLRTNVSPKMYISFRYRIRRYTAFWGQHTQTCVGEALFLTLHFKDALTTE